VLALECGLNGKDKEEKSTQKEILVFLLGFLKTFTSEMIAGSIKLMAHAFSQLWNFM
jgi:hypothetical protein